MIFIKTENGQTRTRKGVSGGSGDSFRVRIFEDLRIAAVIALKTDARPLLGANIDSFAPGGDV